MQYSPSDVDEIEVEISEAKKAVENKKALMRLHTNKDFKRIIHELYFEKESIRLVGIKGSHTLSSEQKENIDNMMYGVSALRMFLQNVLDIGSQMEVAMEDAETEKENILTEAN